MGKVRGAWFVSGALAAAMLVSACLPAAVPETPSSPGSWEVRFEMSGGIAGMVKQMTVSRDGRLVAENVRRGARVEGRLSEDQKRELDRLIGQAKPAQETARGLPRRCADCIQYRLTVRGPEGRPALSESGTLEQEQSENLELIKFLSTLMNERIPP